MAYIVSCLSVYLFIIWFRLDTLVIRSEESRHAVVEVSAYRTGDVEDRLESHAEVSDLVWIVLLDRLQQHANTFPIILTEHGIIVRVQSRALHMNTTT